MSARTPGASGATPVSPEAAPPPEAPSPEDDALLYGHDPTERIVALHLTRAGRMRVYRRLESDVVTWEDEPYHPFVLLDDIERLKGFHRERYQFRPLAGSNAYGYLVVFADRSAYWDALRHVKEHAETEKERPDALYLTGGPEQQYLMQTGRTLFKGMHLDDLRRMQVDLEVYAEGGFPQAEDPEHRIILVAMSDNRGWSRVVGGPLMDEQTVLEEALEHIRERDPDVIEGHNLYGFDLPYLAARCRLHGVPVTIGRDGSVPRSFPSSMRFAERQVEFEAVEIAGRHVIDTLHQVMAFDVFKRDLPNYTLKGAARYFGFAPEGRTYVEGADIARTWREEPEKLIDYALDDVIETAALAEHLSGSTFYLTQMVPMPYGQCARTGPAAKIESLFVRGYLHARQSVPRAEAGSQMVGGYTDVFMTGVVGPVVYADVESLYPSIMLEYGVQPRRDTLGIFPRLLRRLTDLRFETKGAMRQASGDARGELDARQTAYKNVINCFTPDTDVLTPDGLRKVTDLRVGDAVYSLDPETLRAEIKPVTAVMEHEATGEIVRVQNRFVDYLVTPEHRFLTARMKPGGTYGPFAWETAADLLADTVRRRLPPLCPLPGAGAAPEAVHLRDFCDRHEVAYKLGPRGIKELRQQGRWQPETFALADWLEFVGWYVSEGTVYVSKPREYETTTRGVGYRVTICQKRLDGRAAIRALMDRMGLAYGEDQNGLSFSSRVFAEVLEAECGRGSFEKRLPSWVFALPPETLRVLFDALMAGDGDRRGMRYTTPSEGLSRDFVRLGYHLGMRTYVMGQEGTSYRIAVNDPHAGTPRGLSPTVKDEHRGREPYSGRVHCVTVADHHTLLAGRNGKLNWCGQSFYGNLGFGFAAFNDFAEADRVARTGQQILRRIIKLVRERGGRIVEVDTDGVLFVPPEAASGDEATERAFVASLSDEMPPGIRIGFDGRYRRMLSFKKKTYALLGYDGELKVKGSSLVSRSVEKFGRRFVRRAIELLLEEDVQGLHDLYLEHRGRITAHDWRGVASFQRTETIKQPLARYERDVREGKRNRTAAYEVAKREAEASGEPVRIGQRVAYYIASGGGRVFEAARPAALWDPSAPDEDTAHYLGRLDQFASKFEPFFEGEHAFRQVFGEEDLFGFDATGIRLAVKERAPEDLEDDVPF